MYVLQLEFPPEKAYLTYVDDVVIKTLEMWGVKKAKSFRFALHEILINSLAAAERLDSGGESISPISLHLWKDTKLGATVTENYGGVTEDKATMLEKEQELLKEEKPNGRGILLVDHLVDEYKWTHKENGMFEVFIANEL